VTPQKPDDWTLSSVFLDGGDRFAGAMGVGRAVAAAVDGATAALAEGAADELATSAAAADAAGVVGGASSDGGTGVLDVAAGSSAMTGALL
jgi:hypothetical protein